MRFQNQIFMKKTALIFTAFFAVLFASNTAVAQISQVNQTTQGDDDEKQDFINLRNALEGYYQIQVVNSRIKPSVSYDLLRRIKDNQTNDQSIILDHTVQGVRILVLPKNSSQLIESYKKIIYIRE